MISPVSSANHAALSSAQHTSEPSEKSVNAARSFNSFVLEKSLNINTEMKFETNGRGDVAKQIEMLHNSELAKLVSEQSNELNQKIALEMLSK